MQLGYVNSAHLQQGLDTLGRILELVSTLWLSVDPAGRIVAQHAGRTGCASRSTCRRRIPREHEAREATCGSRRCPRHWIGRQRRTRMRLLVQECSAARGFRRGGSCWIAHGATARESAGQATHGSPSARSSSLSTKVERLFERERLGRPRSRDIHCQNPAMRPGLRLTSLDSLRRRPAVVQQASNCKLLDTA